MRIALKVGSTYYPLAGEAGVSERVHSPASGWKHGAALATQALPRVRASYSSEVDRGNLQHDISFSTTRKFATPAAAALYDLDYDSAIPRSGILVMDAVDTDGGIYRRLMASALVYPPQRSLIGCTLFLDYRVTGGAITDGGYIASGATAMVVTGTLARPDHATVVFPLLYESGTANGRPAYEALGDPTHSLYWDSAWYLDDGGGADGWRSMDDVATPDLATTWAPTGDATGVPTVALY